MWRLGGTMFTSPTFDRPGWDPLRGQLDAARPGGAFGEAPLLAVLVAELDSIESAVERGGQDPFGRDAHPFRSLSADLVSARSQLGPQLARLVGGSLDAAQDVRFGRDERPPWMRLLEATRPLRAAVRSGDAVVATFDDALLAAETIDRDRGYGRLTRHLDDLRAIAELQGRTWRSVSRMVSSQLTRQDTDAEGAADRRLDDLRAALGPLPAEEEWAIWVGALACPGGEDDRRPSIVSGPVAVCGVPCRADVGAWLQEARLSLMRAFAEAGVDPPADVQRLGDPVMFRGHEWESAAEFWGSLAEPPSFVARVTVLAASREQATAKAKAAVRALYAMDDPRVARDLRHTARAWSPTHGWVSGGVHASDLALGEVLAAQTGLRAAAVWARDLPSPMSDADLDRLAARSLVRDPDASLAVRLAWAFSSIEALRSPGLRPDAFAYRLWYHDAWDRAHRLVEDAMTAVSSVALQWDIDDPDARRQLHRLQVEMNSESRGAPRDSRMRLALAAAAKLGVGHPHRRFVEESAAVLSDPSAYSTQRSDHTAAFRRAQRHRNLVVHGHALADAALAPSVEFLTRQLEVAIGAEDAHMRARGTACLGSLRSLPSVPDADEGTFAGLADLVDRAGKPPD